MPENQNTNQQQKQAVSKIDWTRKGFGWVPDYPDIRDFFPFPAPNGKDSRIQKVIQKDGVTDAIDDLTENLVRIVRLLKQKFNQADEPAKEIDDSLQEALEALENKANAGVRFNTAKVYRVLSNRISNTSSNKDQEQEILQLKKNLYSIQDELFSKEFRKLFPRGSEEEIGWLTSVEFCEKTVELVKDFQKKLNLRADGIVGINTFLTLERYLSFRDLMEDERDTFIKTQPNAEYLKEVRKEEILQLKQCLKKLLNITSLRRLDKNSGQTVDNWLREKKFDPQTTHFVKLFQKKAGLQPSGIVRYDTFLMLRKYYAHPECFNQIAKLSNSGLAEKPDCAKPTVVENPAKLVTTSSLIPDQLFGELIDQLYCEWCGRPNATEGIFPDEITVNDLIDRVNVPKDDSINQICENTGFNLVTCESVALDKSSFSTYVSPHVGGYVEDDRRNARMNCILDQIRSRSACRNVKVTRQEFVKLCKSEFIIIDPIVSVILITVSPLASRSSPKIAMLDGITQFKSLLTVDISSAHQHATNAYLPKLARKALYKAKSILETEKEELENLIKSCKKDIFTSGSASGNPRHELANSLCQKENSILIYYSFLQLIFERWLSESDKDDNESDKGDNEFEKKEHFQLVLAEEVIGEEEYFKLQPGETSSEKIDFTTTADKTRFRVAESASPKEGQCSVFEENSSSRRSEIILPVASSATRLKDSKLNQKQFYFLLPGAVDLSYWCSPVEDQQGLNTCTAFAGIGLLEYFAKRTFGEYEDLSALFLYKSARDLRQRYGDVGAPLRDIMRSMILFGVPPEKYWPYRPENLDHEPPTFCYSYAQNYQTLKYFRLDPADLSPNNLLLKVKAVLAAGFPCMFGFTAYSSIYDEANIENGYIPFPDPNRDRVVGGHAVVAVGYNDHKCIPYADGTRRAGALLIRNSWGREWGVEGYGWLPYDYVLKGLTADWWSLLKAEWFGRGYFGLEARDPGDPPGRDNVTTTVSGR